MPMPPLLYRLFSRRLIIVLLVILIFTQINIILQFIRGNKHGENARNVANIKFESNLGVSSLQNTSLNTNLKDFIKFRNAQARVKKFPGFSFNYVFLVQVHNRPEYLAALIKSLSKLANIDQVLLIFSHDHYSPLINSIIANIKFTKCLQIFYPFTNEVYINRFPGQNPLDCNATNMNKGCINSEWPDTYKNYRESRISQIKLHWLWKIQFCLNRIEMMREFQGPILLLEEDYYVLEDTLQVISLLYLSKKNELDGIIFSIGSFHKPQFALENNVVSFSQLWLSSSHNTGIVLNRKLWSRLSQHLENAFCYYDDYNWDWSMSNLLRSYGATLRLQYFNLKHNARVFHIGSCGMHQQASSCSPTPEISKIFNFLQPNLHKLYPKELSFNNHDETNFIFKNNGGFADPRDQVLCASLVSMRWKDPAMHPDWNKNPHARSSHILPLIDDSLLSPDPLI